MRPLACHTGMSVATSQSLATDKASLLFPERDSTRQAANPDSVNRKGFLDGASMSKMGESSGARLGLERVVYALGACPRACRRAARRPVRTPRRHASLQ